MDRPRSSRHGNPLTFNVATMFLFYVLSVSLCLSSFSTCVCVIFNPVGILRTIANYFFYALGLSVLLTFLFVGLTGVCFDIQTSPESPAEQEIVNETLNPAEHHEAPASQEAVDPAPIQELPHEVSAPQEVFDATPIQEEHLEVSAPQEVEEATLTLEAEREVSAQQDIVEAIITRSPPTPPLAMIDTAKAANRPPRFCEEISASPKEESHAAQQKQNASGANAAKHAETAGQDKAIANVITARESKKIEKWISQTTSAETPAAQTVCGTLKEDEVLDEDLKGEMAEIMAWGRNNGDYQSVIRCVSPDSGFQKALRVYMGKEGRYGGRERRSGSSTPSEGSSEESVFQGLVRKRFMLEKVGEKRAGGKEESA